MIQFELTQGSGKTKKVHPFSVPQIQDITVSRFVKFQEDVMTLKPQSLAEYESEQDEVKSKLLIDKIEPEEIINEWGDHYLRVVQFWTKIPLELLSLLTREQSSWVYKVMTMTLLRHKHDPNKMSFSHKGMTFLFPPAFENNLIKGQKDYMKGTRIIDMVEAFQFEKFGTQLSKSEWGSLPFIIAILCRQKGEELPVMSADREKFIGERKMIMDSLPLQHAFDVAFFLTSQKLISKKYSDLFSLLHLKKELQQEKISGTYMVGTSH